LHHKNKIAFKVKVMEEILKIFYALHW